MLPTTTLNPPKLTLKLPTPPRLTPTQAQAPIQAPPPTTQKRTIRLRKKTLYDEYILTSKHIIYKFKYLIVFFDAVNDDSTPSSLVSLTKERFQEALTNQDISFKAEPYSAPFQDILSYLKEWHPSISDVVFDYDNIYSINHLQDYNLNWSLYEPIMKSIPDNTNILNEQEFTVFKKSPHIAIDVKVYFKLNKRVNNANAVGINFEYAKKLLENEILEWNKKQHVFLDEIIVKKRDVPFVTEENETDEYFVYPRMYIIPLYHEV